LVEYCCKKGWVIIDEIWLWQYVARVNCLVILIAYDLVLRL